MFRQLVVCVAFTTIASIAQAQLVTGPAKPLSFGIAAGAAVPTSDLSDFTNTGYNGTLMLGLNTPSLPFNFRIDGAYNDFGDKYDNKSLHTTSLTGNIVLYASYAIYGAAVLDWGDWTVQYGDQRLINPGIPREPRQILGSTLVVG